MKTNAFIFLSLLICNLLPAQNIKLDIKPHFMEVRADSLFLSMDMLVNVEDMGLKTPVMLIPVLTSQERRVLLPPVQLNGKQKHKLYLRSQILRKKNGTNDSNKAYLVLGVEEGHSQNIAYRTSLPAESWMNEASLYLRRTVVKPDGEHSLKDTLIITQQQNSYTPFFDEKPVQEKEPVYAGFPLPLQCRALRK